MILIGSKAIKFWFPDFNRKPKDIDYAVNNKTSSGEKGVEYLYNPILYKWGCGNILTPDELYTLKISHVVGWKLENNSWDKHLWDINFLKNKGCKLIKPLFDDLYTFWGEIHGKNKRSDLEMSSEDFFDNALECKYSHDWLHTLINPIPTYTKVLKGEVEISEDKFNQLSQDEKKQLVREEVEIMSFERFSNIPYLHAYSRMLKKFVLNHAALFEAIWIIENWVKLHKAKYNFIKYLNEKINERGNNIIKRSSRFVKE